MSENDVEYGVNICDVVAGGSQVTIIKTTTNHSSRQECVREESNSTSITITQQMISRMNIFPK